MLEGPRAGVGFLGRGSKPPPYQLEGLGERCKLPSGVWGGAAAAKRFSRVLNTQDDHSGQQDYGPLAQNI